MINVPSILKKGIITGLLLVLIAGGLCAAAEENAATRRFGIFIGSNNGGRDRVMLRYAVTDAKSVSRVFSGMGGIAQNDNVLLIEPSVADINRQIDQLGRQAAQLKQNAQRTELVFYYSGHSDENGILLNRERYGYRELRERINTVQSDMRIVILDSCSSGSITRAKGGVKTQPFLFDSSISAAGYAILTSSSANEASQESDHIESSYFTHSMLAGLRGAADTVGDGRVTLNELYRFAYAETLAKTETSLYGAQHPSFDIQISGSGDVVLTDIKETSAGLLIGEDLAGRISIRDSSDFLVAELTKAGNKPMELGLEPGSYRITLQQGNNFFRADVTLTENQRTGLGMADFTMIAADAAAGRSRGDSNETGVEESSADTEGGTQHIPFSFHVVPGVGFPWGDSHNTTNNFMLGLLMAKGHNLNGLGAASIGLINTGYVHGVQASGIFNMAESEVHGVQGSGIFNIAEGDLRGVQASGIFNMAEGEVHGVQGSGIFNMTGGNVDGVQGAGIFNWADGNVSGSQGSGIFNYAGGAVEGAQGAGILNYAGSIEGAQVGVINITKGGKGAMIGVVNISESEENNVPFGLVNIFKNGIMHPMVYVDDMLFTNIGLRSGSKHFYSFFSFGTGGEYLFKRAGNTYIASHVGFGFEYRVQKLFFTIDASSGNIYQIPAEFRWNGNEDAKHLEVDTLTSGIHQLRLTVGYQIFKHLGVFAGISYDHLWRNESNPNTLTPTDFGGLFIGDTFGNHTHKLGFFGGIQF